MTTDGNRPIEACLIDLFRHLGIERAHIAAGQQSGGDWPGLAAYRQLSALGNSKARQGGRMAPFS